MAPIECVIILFLATAPCPGYSGCLGTQDDPMLNMPKHDKPKEEHPIFFDFSKLNDIREEWPC